MNKALIEERLSQAGYSRETINLITEMFNACDPNQSAINDKQIDQWGKKLDKLSTRAELVKQLKERGVFQDDKVSTKQYFEKHQVGYIVRPSSKGDDYITVSLKRNNTNATNIHYKITPEGGFNDPKGRHFPNIDHLLKHHEPIPLI